MTDPFSAPRETDKLPFWVWYCFSVLCLNLIDAFPFRLSELSNFGTYLYILYVWPFQFFIPNMAGFSIDLQTIFLKLTTWIK